MMINDDMSVTPDRHAHRRAEPIRKYDGRIKRMSHHYSAMRMMAIVATYDIMALPSSTKGQNRISIHFQLIFGM